MVTRYAESFELKEIEKPRNRLSTKVSLTLPLLPLHFLFGRVGWAFLWSSLHDAGKCFQECTCLESPPYMDFSVSHYVEKNSQERLKIIPFLLLRNATKRPYVLTKIICLLFIISSCVFLTCGNLCPETSTFWTSEHYINFSHWGFLWDSWFVWLLVQRHMINSYISFSVILASVYFRVSNIEPSECSRTNLFFLIHSINITEYPPCARNTPCTRYCGLGTMTWWRQTGLLQQQQALVTGPLKTTPPLCSHLQSGPQGPTSTMPGSLTFSFRQTPPLGRWSMLCLSLGYSIILTKPL